ncbi:hypothetical protein ACP70R_030284 [Stipagrostis hirtigluma subsp. patula]
MTIELALAASSSSTTMPGGRGGMPSPCTALPPGFRFHPTDEELILYYLRKRAAAAPCPAPVVAEVDIYKFDPWDLPAKAVFGEGEWYFFSPRDRKYPNGVRPNRAAGSGYWKATGTDKPITLSAAPAAESSESSGAMIGVKKALVFYRGRPPKGMKTSWIMHEYRLAEALAAANTYRPMRFKDSSMRLDDWVLCRIYKKPSPQLSYSSSPPPLDGEPYMGDGHGHSVDDVVNTYAPAGRLTRPPSISDYLVDYSAVSELFESLPAPEMPQLGTDHTAGSSGAGAGGRFFVGADNEAGSSAAQQSSHKRRLMEDYSNSGMETIAQASNKRVLSDASMAAVDNTFSLFGPGQTSLQDRM